MLGKVKVKATAPEMDTDVTDGSSKMVQGNISLNEPLVTFRYSLSFLSLIILTFLEAKIYTVIILPVSRFIGLEG